MSLIAILIRNISTSNPQDHSFFERPVLGALKKTKKSLAVESATYNYVKIRATYLSPPSFPQSITYGHVECLNLETDMGRVQFRAEMPPSQWKIFPLGKPHV